MKRITAMGIIVIFLLSNIMIIGNAFGSGLEIGDDIAPISSNSVAPLGSRVPHAIIRINNNPEFQTQAGIEGWAGNGLQGTPFIIEDYIINANGNGTCIYIGNTSVYFIIRNCSLSYASGDTLPWGYGAGITLSSVQYGRIESNNISNNNRGVVLYSSNFNTIHNNTCSNNNQTGIYLDGTSDYNIITNNTCESNNYTGIFLTVSRFNIFENNTCNNNSFYGIYFYTSGKYNVINNNTCNFNKVNGIFLENYCSDNEITNNTCNLNIHNGISVEFYSDDNIITNNTCQSNNWSGIFVYGLSNNNIIKYNNCTTNNMYGIGIFSCDRTGIENNTCNNNSDGIWIQGSRWNNIANNSCIQNNNSGIYIGSSISSNITNNICNLNNDTGINLSASDNNKLNNNTCNMNYGVGIFLSLSDNNIINNSDFSNNIKGVELLGSFTGINNNQLYENSISLNIDHGLFFTGICTNNRMFHNNIISNVNQAGGGAAGSILWDDGAGEGNYWSDYTGLDNGANGRFAGDGIGDTNIPHPTTGYDNYPFTNKDGWKVLPLPVLHDPGVINSTGNYTITWNSSPRAIGYILEEDTDGSFSSPNLIYYGPNLSFEVTNKSDGEYYYHLKIYNDYTESEWSPAVDIYVDLAPSAPTGLIVKNITGHNVTLKWNLNSEDDIQEYYVYKNATGSGSKEPFVYVEQLHNSMFEYKVTELEEETVYYFVITATDFSLTHSPYSNVASATTKDETKPSAPAGLNATAISDSEIKLVWDANTDADLAGYHVFMNQSGEDAAGKFELKKILVGDSTTYTVTGLSEQVTYHFKMRAFDEVPNNSSFSLVASATPPDLNAPAAPTGLRIIGSNETSITITWNANLETDLVGYFVYRGSGTSFSPVNVVPINDTFYIDSGLIPQTKYYYKVTAVDDAPWESAESEIVSGDTTAVSQAPVINNSISDFSIIEDSYDNSHINLFYWFKSLYNYPMEFSVANDNHINVSIFTGNGTVVLVPEPNWNGQETLTFSASIADRSISDSVIVTVTGLNDPPEQVSILSPLDGSTLKYGDGQTFSGNCIDHDLIYGDELIYTWTSSLEGTIGIGQDLIGVMLSAGNHTITLEVRDKANQGASTTINIIIQEIEDKPDDDDIEMPMSIGLFPYDLLVILFIIIIVVILVLIVVSYVTLKKKKRSPTEEEPEEPPVPAEPDEEVSESNEPEQPIEPVTESEQPQPFEPLVPEPGQVQDTTQIVPEELPTQPQPTHEAEITPSSEPPADEMGALEYPAAPEPDITQIQDSELVEDSEAESETFIDESPETTEHFEQTEEPAKPKPEDSEQSE
jgi:parallel beta-helix repeat protein